MRLSVILPYLAAALAVDASWTGWGGNNYNNRWATNNSDVDTNSVMSLSPHCQKVYVSLIRKATSRFERLRGIGSDLY